MFVTGLLFLVILVLLRQQRSSLLSLTLTGVYLRMGRRDPQGQMIRLSVSGGEAEPAKKRARAIQHNGSPPMDEMTAPGVRHRPWEAVAAASLSACFLACPQGEL